MIERKPCLFFHATEGVFCQFIEPDPVLLATGDALGLPKGLYTLFAKHDNKGHRFYARDVALFGSGSQNVIDAWLKRQPDEAFKSGFFRPTEQMYPRREGFFREAEEPVPMWPSWGTSPPEVHCRCMPVLDEKGKAIGELQRLIAEYNEAMRLADEKREAFNRVEAEVTRLGDELTRLRQIFDEKMAAMRPLADERHANYQRAEELKTKIAAANQGLLKSLGYGPRGDAPR